MEDKIVIKGAKEHNLKNVDLTLPRNKMIVFTGLSGSGKSSLAFDTIYAEGQRRYVESLSSYARQFLGQMEKPSVDYIDGLSPAISIDQKTTSQNPRSTVGTVTEIYDYLRLMFAHIGKPHCPICGEEIKQMTTQEMVDIVQTFEEGSRIYIISPVIRGKKGKHEKVLESIKKSGYVRIRIDGENFDITDEIDLDKNKKHTIEVIIDRLKIRPNLEKRLSDSIEAALKLSDGLVIILQEKDGLEKEHMFSSEFTCPEHGIGMQELTPRIFSFNNPYGACERCNGLGSMNKADVDLIVPDKNLSLHQGAIDAWNTKDSSRETGYYYKLLEGLAKKEGVSMHTPFKDLPKKFVDKLLYGTSDIIEFTFDSKFGGRRKYKSDFEGVVNNIERRYEQTKSQAIRDKIDNYIVEDLCPSCNGQRLKPEVLAVTVGGENISQVCEKSIYELVDYLDNLDLTEKEKIIASEVIKEIRNRANFLKDVGLGYLTLMRKASTLSGGESQRIRLATQIGSALVGVLYVLDEPSIGLHQRDNERLLLTLRNLTDIGNTLIVVEHDEDTIKAADYIVDIGPYAGIHGGNIVAQGSQKDIMANKNSITGQFLSGKRKIEIPKERRQKVNGFLKVLGASENNLKNIDVEIPLGVFTCVTGVSGSGKSTLVNEIIYKAASSKINRSKERPGKHLKIEGLEKIDKVVNIDQSPIGKTPRSNPATYTGVFDTIREVFAMTPEAKSRGYQKGRFSFNVKGGRCEACTGDGILKIEMHFLPDVYVPCEVCKGLRYNRETLQVKYKGKTISDVLDMDVETAMEFFENIPTIKRKLKVLNDVGLGYIKLGQNSTQLSGGEAQRVKLATELSKKATGNTLYILDEPTTGLHTADVEKLIDILQKLADNNNTILVIEHNLDVIKSCDHIIDLGPEGGDGGGEIVAIGTPEEVASNPNSYTGEFLKKSFQNK